MNNTKVSRRLFLGAASTLPLVACIGEGEAPGTITVALNEADAPFSRFERGLENIELVLPLTGSIWSERRVVINELVSGQRAQFHARVELLGESRQVVRTVEFRDCVPVRYELPSAAIGQESATSATLVFRASDIRG